MTTGFIEATIDGELVRAEVVKRNFYIPAAKVLVIEGFTAEEGGRRLMLAVSGYVLEDLDFPASLTTNSSQTQTAELVYKDAPERETTLNLKPPEGEIVIDYWDGSTLRGRFEGPLREFDAKAHPNEQWGTEEIPLTKGRFEVVVENR